MLPTLSTSAVQSWRAPPDSRNTSERSLQVWPGLRIDGQERHAVAAQDADLPVVAERDRGDARQVAVRDAIADEARGLEPVHATGELLLHHVQGLARSCARACSPRAVTSMRVLPENGPVRSS